MQATKRAMYSILSGDATLMGLLEQAPYMGRLPDGAKIGRTKGAISIDGETSVVSADKEDQTLTLHVWTERHDLAETIYERLVVLLHPGAPGGWKVLAVSEGRAFVRLESALDVPDPTSELYHKACRFRIRYARPRA